MTSKIIRRGKRNLLVEAYDRKCHKKRFSSPAKARKFIKNQSGRSHMDRPVKQIYQCQYCGQWHLTSQTKAEYDASRQSTLSQSDDPT